MVSNVDSPQRKMQILTLKKTGLGTPAISGSCANFCTVTYNGVGDYNINFTKKPFTLTPEILLTVVTAQRVLRIGTVTNTSVQVLAFQMDGTTAAEADFHMMAIGTLAQDLLG